MPFGASAIRQRLLKSATVLLDRLRGEIVGAADPADVVKVFRRHPRYIRGTNAYAEAGPYLPERWDLQAVAQVFPDALPPLRCEKGGFTNHREEVLDWLKSLLGDGESGLNKVDLITIVRWLDDLYYQILDDRLRSEYESMLRLPVWRKELETLHRRRGGMRTKPGRVSPLALEEINAEIDEFGEHVQGLTEDLEAADFLGMVGGFTAKFKWITRNKKGKQRVCRPRRLGRPQDLPAFTSFCVKLNAVLERRGWPPGERDNVIDELLAVVFHADWYGLPDPGSRRVLKRVERELARRKSQKKARRRRRRTKRRCERGPRCR